MNSDGITEEQLRTRLRDRSWMTVQRGVYRTAGVHPSREQAILAACLAGGDHAVASHRAAAWLWDFLAPGAVVVEITVPHDARRALDGVVVHRSRRPAQFVWHKGIPVTSPVDTLIGLVEVANADVLGRCLDRAQRKGCVRGADLMAALSGRGSQGRSGVSVLRRVLAERGYPEIHASVLERRTLAVLRAAALPEPKREFGTGPGMRYRVDFAWPNTRVLLEVDGFDTHGTPEALQADLARQNELVSAGWAPLRYTWRDITQTPGQVTRQVGEMLAKAGLLPKWGN